MTTFVRAGTLTFVIVGADVAAGAVVVGADVIITTLGVLGALVMVMLGVGRTSIIVCSKRRKKMPLKHSWIWIMMNYNYNDGCCARESCIVRRDIVSRAR